MKRSIAIAAIAISGCGPSAAPPGDSGVRLDPVAFFSGRSHGEARLSKIIGGDERVTVDSFGKRDGHHGLILDQTIREGSKLARQRRWTIIPAGPGRFTGALTDATGPVAVTVSGARATIRYRMKNGLDVEQRLALKRDGRTMLNELEVKKFGIRVAELNETIRKLD